MLSAVFGLRCEKQKNTGCGVVLLQLTGMEDLDGALLLMPCPVPLSPTANLFIENSFSGNFCQLHIVNSIRISAEQVLWKTV